MAKRTMLVCLAVTVLLALTAGVALAKTIQGSNGRDEGTPMADVMRGFEGSDDLLGRGGAEKLYGGRDEDTFDARPAWRMDEVYCGDGSDTAHASSEDFVADDCEAVELVGNP